jgi:hypothetical protein
MREPRRQLARPHEQTQQPQWVCHNRPRYCVLTARTQRGSADLVYRRRSSDPGDVGDDDLIVRPDTERHKREVAESAYHPLATASLTYRISLSVIHGPAIGIRADINPSPFARAVGRMPYPPTRSQCHSRPARSRLLPSQQVNAPHFQAPLALTHCIQAREAARIIGDSASIRLDGLVPAHVIGAAAGAGMVFWGLDSPDRMIIAAACLKQMVP